MSITHPDLLGREAFESYVLSLPGVTLVHQWGDASVAKVGGKIFALLSGWLTEGEPGLSFKCSELSFAMLPELEHVRPAPYLARAQWVQVTPGAPLDDVELRAYVAEAHRIVAGRLTRKVRAELGWLDLRRLARPTPTLDPSPQGGGRRLMDLSSIPARRHRPSGGCPED